nr:hypothetical protein [Tanacetum cinerariifolium]
MAYPRFTKIIINHFLKQHKSLTNLNHKHYHIIKEDGIVIRLKFVRIGEDYQEYGLPIPDVMLTDVIKRLESYQMFIKYSTPQIPPKKNRGKAKKKISMKRRFKKKVTLSVDDNIISVDPDVALELAKFISQTKAKEAEAARKVHAKHARIMTESVLESAKKNSSALYLTPEQQEAIDIMQALVESKKSSKRQPGVSDESTVIFTTLSKGTGAKPGVLDEEKDITKENDDKDDEVDDHISDTQDANDEDDEEMINAEVDDSDKGDEKITDASKADAVKTSKAKDDAKKTKLLPSSSRNPANHRLYHALVEAFIEDENAMDKGGKKTKRIRTKESESFKKLSFTKDTLKGKAPTKGSKTSKSAFAKEPVEEAIAEVVMDDVGDDVAHDDKQMKDTSKPKTRRTLNLYWFKQPLRPPTLDPEWNKSQVVLDQPEQPWFNQMVSASKDLLTFNDLMATPIDFSKYVLNGLKIENLTQDILLGHAFNWLKGTCSSKGDHYPLDLSKTLPLQGPSGHRTVAVDYFFNNDLEYLKTFDPEITYTSSITKTKAAQYEIKGIKDMVPTLWSTIKHLYDKDAKKGINHWMKDANCGTDLRVIDFRLDYNKEMLKRKWTVVDQKRSSLMIELIDKQQ